MTSIDTGARGRIYAFLSRLWVRELDEEAIAALGSALGRALLLGFWASEEPACLRPETTRQATFDADFVHLTVVNLVPYESFYRREDGLVESGAVNPAATFLRRYGFEVDLAAARALAPDHLGIELEALSVLCEKEREAEARGEGDTAADVRRVERELLTEHVLAWAPLYLMAARRAARTTLYREAADATLHFLHADLGALA